MKSLAALIFIIGILSTSVFAEWKSNDVRYPELLDKQKNETIQVGDGMTASREGESIVVDIPGVSLDSLSGYPSRPLTLQLAASAFVKVCNTPVKTGSEAIEKLYKGSKEVRQGSGDVFTEYTFDLRKGRRTQIFVYLNEISGLVAVIKMPRDSRSK